MAARRVTTARARLGSSAGRRSCSRAPGRVAASPREAGRQEGASAGARVPGPAGRPGEGRAPPRWSEPGGPSAAALLASGPRRPRGREIQTAGARPPGRAGPRGPRGPVRRPLAWRAGWPGGGSRSPVRAAFPGGNGDSVRTPSGELGLQSGKEPPARGRWRGWRAGWAGLRGKRGQAPGQLLTGWSGVR